MLTKLFPSQPCITLAEVFLSTGQSFGSGGESMSVRMCVFVFRTQIVFSRWCLHNEYTMSLNSTSCLNASKQQSSQLLSLHACHCCCHSYSCLSLTFCVLELLIYSSFFPDTLHLIWDEITGAGDKMFPYHGYVKLTRFSVTLLILAEQ